MAQEIAIDANYRMPEPVRVGEETGSSTAWIQNLIFTVDHKKLGLMYIGAALLFFAVAGVLAALAGDFGVSEKFIAVRLSRYGLVEGGI